MHSVVRIDHAVTGHEGYGPCVHFFPLFRVRIPVRFGDPFTALLFQHIDRVEVPKKFTRAAGFILQALLLRRHHVRVRARGGLELLFFKSFNILIF